VHVKFDFLFFSMSRLADKEAGQVPVAYIVCKPHQSVTEKEVLDFVAEQVLDFFQHPLKTLDWLHA
jgi:hypothetical protein